MTTQPCSRRSSGISTSSASSPYATTSCRESIGSMTSPSINSESFVPCLPTPVEPVDDEVSHFHHPTLDETQPPPVVPPKSPSTKKLRKYRCPMARCDMVYQYRRWLVTHIVMKHPDSQQAAFCQANMASFQSSKSHESTAMPQAITNSQRYSPVHIINAMTRSNLRGFVPDWFVRPEPISTVTYEDHLSTSSADMSPEHSHNDSSRQRLDYDVGDTSADNETQLHQQPAIECLSSPQRSVSSFGSPVTQRRNAPTISWAQEIDTVCSDYPYRPVMQEVDLAQSAMFGLVQQQLTYQ